MKCPNCGAEVKEGKFCNYCGASLPDNTKRFEVNINKRVEDVAEMKRADYETEESRLRQKQELRKYRARSTRRIAILIVLAISIIGMLIGMNSNAGGSIALMTIFAMCVAALMLVYTVLLLITGKW